MSRRYTHGGRVDNRDKGPFISPTMIAAAWSIAYACGLSREAWS